MLTNEKRDKGKNPWTLAALLFAGKGVSGKYFDCRWELVSFFFFNLNQSGITQPCWGIKNTKLCIGMESYGNSVLGCTRCDSVQFLGSSMHNKFCPIHQHTQKV